jgi:crotonobetaine/carnitine-CoA ligase
MEGLVSDVTTWVSTKGLTVLDVLKQRAELEPERPFCQFDEGPWHSYGDFFNRCVALAHQLVGHGLQKGDRVEVWMSTRIDYLVAMFGIPLAGGVYVPLNSEYSPEQVASTVELCGARLIITDRSADEIAAVRASEAACQLEPLLVDAVGAISDRAGNALTDGAGATLPAVSSDDAALIMYTSGTTGKPKGVTFSQGNLMYVGQVKTSGLRYTRADRALDFFPLHHFNGGFQQILPIVICGASIILKSAFDAAGFSDQLVRHNITLTAVNSSHVYDLLAAPPSPNDDRHGCYRMMLGLALDDTTHERFEKRFNTKLLGVYGLTEALGPFIAGTIDYLSPRRSSGRPIPGYEVEIIGAKGEALGPGEAGEVRVRATVPHSFFMGYWNDPIKTNELFHGGWIHSGDLGYFDPDGSFYYLQRLVDQVHRKGRIFAPALAEDVLRSAPGVGEAVVLGLSDDEEHETLVAVVVLRADEATPAPDIDAVAAYCTDRLEADLQPDRWFAVDKITKDILGKVDRKRLRVEMKQRVSEDPRT